jgi:Zn-dependent peptidase ImmA (M78 family)
LYVDVNPEILKWACDRSGKAEDALKKSFPKVSEWLNGEKKITIKQLEKFAKATYTSVGFFFLSEPPEEKLPLPDFRTVANKYVGNPSPNLLDTVYICQQRQEWYREYAKTNGEEPLKFVGSVQVSSEVIETAAKIRKKLNFEVENRSKMTNWESALSYFIENVEESGILVMRNGVYLNNNFRHLDVEEFRGFSISDEFAPLIFINGADTKAAQIFTLAHEVAHIWLGISGVTDAHLSSFSRNRTEKWCNSVAAEILVPVSSIKKEFSEKEYLRNELNRLATFYQVSTLVILRRIFDIGAISKDEFWILFKTELERLKSFKKKGGGGDFYKTQKFRVSANFARALLVSTLEGRTLHRDAFKLLGFSKLSTFRELGSFYGVGI